ncbi:hypothetical protein CGRA01v4_07088 [Colletotrichum graminicola]|nr:hypothetical protein CGRA01v4_07088 [Colletotrichum graminicola]
MVLPFDRWHLRCLGVLPLILFLLDLEAPELNLAGLSALLFSSLPTSQRRQQRQPASSIGLHYMMVVLSTLPLAIVPRQGVPPGTFAWASVTVS